MQLAIIKKPLVFMNNSKIGIGLRETLAKWGRVLEAQSKFSEALPIYIRGFVIASEHDREFIRVGISMLLARILQVLGENEFDTIWREVTGEECAGEVREAIWAARDRLDGEG